MIENIRFDSRYNKNARNRPFRIFPLFIVFLLGYSQKVENSIASASLIYVVQNTGIFLNTETFESDISW